MGMGTDHVLVGQAKTAGFVPEVWSDEIIAAYKKNLVAANLIKKMNFKGKKGDKVYFPAPVRGNATAKSKTAQAQVTLIAESGTSLSVSIDQHYEYSRLIEDITEVQAQSSLRRFYTDDAGYALSTRIDTDVLAQAAKAQGGNGTAAYNAAVIGGDGTTAYTSGANNASALTDAGIRKVIQTLDDQDVPMDGRFMIIPPVARNTLLGLSRFTEQAFVGSGDSIRNVLANLLAHATRSGVDGCLGHVLILSDSKCEGLLLQCRSALARALAGARLCAPGQSRGPRPATDPLTHGP